MIIILLYQTVVFTMHGKIQKGHTKMMNLKYQFQHGMKSFSYLMDYILDQIFKITLNKIKKITLKKIENRRLK